MKYLIYSLLSFLPLLGVSQAIPRGVIVSGDSTVVTGNTYAVVIGLSKYKEVTPLVYADRDAQVFADFLTDKNGMGLDPANVKLFVNGAATLSNIGDALSDIIIKKLKKGDRVIFFFAGHGDYDANILKDQALLLLYNAPKQNYFQNIFSGDFISTADLNSRFIEPLVSKNCEVILIIDACHATGLNKSLSGGQEGGKITMQALQSMTSPVKIYSCKANEYSLEGAQWGGGRGLFSYELMEGLYGMADLDNDKTVTLRELQRYLEDNVPKMAAPNKQNPVVKIDDADKPVARVNDSLLIAYRQKKDKDLVFITKASVKGNEATWMNEADTARRALLRECDSLVERKELSIAFEKFVQYAKDDSTSNGSLQLRRNLSAALQEKTAIMLTPLLEDVSRFKFSNAEILAAASDLEKAAFLLGESHFLQKNLQARILFLKAISLDDSKNDQIISLLEQSQALEPNAPYTYFNLASAYQNANNVEKAKLYYDKYINLIPNSSWAYSNLGLLYEDLDEYANAIKYFKKALALDPGNADIYNDLGLMYSGLKKYNEAISHFKKAIALTPNEPESYANLASVYDDLNNIPQAINYYKKSVELNVDDAEILNNLGLLYFHSKKDVEAKKYFRKAIEVDARYAPAFNNMALLEMNRKNFSIAIGYCQKALAIDPEHAISLFNLGLCYLNLARYPESETAFKKVIELKPNEVNAYYNIACGYSLERRADSALKYFAIALEKNYTDLKTTETDKDLNNICTLPAYRTLLEKYFTKAQLAKYPKMFAKKP